MHDALVGYTGFVGGSLMNKRSFEDRYHSKNIEAIAGKKYRLVVCAGAPAEKWRANKEPVQDLANLQRLMNCLKQCEAERFVLISTIDVYHPPVEVDEDSQVSPEVNHAYGRNRFQLERFVMDTFPQHHVLRLPALYGPGLKKNLVFDLLQGRNPEWTHRDSSFQFYHTARLWDDCKTVIAEDIPLVNLAVEPVGVRDIARHCFGLNFDNVTEAPPATYDMHTRYGAAFGRPGSKYIETRAETLAGISNFVRQARAAA